MSKFLYKYMSFRADFFKEPMIRATPTLALNDPFEGGFNNKQVKDADRNQREYYRKNGKNIREANEFDIHDIVSGIQTDLFDLGVISFTEDFNSPLMWAHYADEHRGFVVEFNFNEPFFLHSIKELNGRASRFGECCFGEVYEFPEKVDYRREMPDFSRFESSAPNNMNEFHWKKFNQTILFTKSNDWIYEKEQRSIVRLKDADSIICVDNEDVRNECSKDEKIKLLELKNGKIQITFPNEYEMHEKMGDESIKTELYNLTRCFNEPAVHLFRVNPLAISGIYFGCKSKHSDALYNIDNNKSLTNLNHRYKMKVNSHLYQLDKIELE